MAYTEVQARLAIVSKILEIYSASNFSSVPLYGENGPPPPLDKLNTLLNYEIVFDDAKQAALGEDPPVRTWGRIEFVMGTKEGTGTLKLLEIRSELAQKLKAKAFENVKLLIPRPSQGGNSNGWVFLQLYVPFYFDSEGIV